MNEFSYNFPESFRSLLPNSYPKYLNEIPSSIALIRVEACKKYGNCFRHRFGNRLCFSRENNMKFAHQKYENYHHNKSEIVFQLFS